MKENPQYWELLSDDDKTKFTEMQQEFSSGVLKRVRNSRAETFDEILEIIKRFCVRNDDDDWKRYLVCGVCWMDSAIAINTRQLRILVCKCKSSINGSLQKMGYTTNMAHSESWKILFPKIPLLKDHFPELRKWTIRYKPGQLPPLPMDISKNKETKARDVPVPPLPSVSEDKHSSGEESSPPVEERSSHFQGGSVPTLPSVPLKFRQKMIRLQSIET